MCVASLKSMTVAMKAQRALSKDNISCEIIRLEPSMTKNGCAYGIKFNCLSLYSVQNALNTNKIKYSEIISL